MARDRRQECPKMARCPLFPEFTQKSVLRVFQTHFCRGAYESCARYKLAMSGRMPPPRLLPDGDMLPEREPTEDEAPASVAP